MSEETTQTFGWPTRPEMEQATLPVSSSPSGTRFLYVHDMKHAGSAEGNEVSKWVTIIGMSIATCGIFPVFMGVFMLIEKFREDKAKRNGVPYKPWG